MPEMTLAAYKLAIEQGAEALECDVRLTVDGELVCFHDRTMRRVAGSDAVVSSLTLTQLEEYDVGSWKRAGLGEDGTRILTLQSLLELARDCGRPVDLAIEAKHPSKNGFKLERRLVELLDYFGWTGDYSPVRVMSFSPVAIMRVERLAPRLEVVLLVDHPYSWRATSRMLRPGWIAGPGLEVLKRQPLLVERLKRTGRRVHVWTVNEPADWDLCAAWGVEAVITDKPGAALAHFT